MSANTRALRWGATLAFALPIWAQAQPSGSPVPRPASAYIRAPALGSASSLSATRLQFEQAYARTEAYLPGQSATDSAALKAYPLYPYLQAARIEQALLAASGSTVPADRRAGAFLAAHGGEPVTYELRRAWLESLAQRSQWGLFLQAYRPTPAGIDLRCRSYAARIGLGETQGLASAVERLWLTPHSLPDCAPAFTWLEGTGRLTPALIAQRARLALEASDPAFARRIIERLPRGPVAASLLEWTALLEHPQAAIDRLLASPTRTVDPKAQLAGWSLLARKDPRAAERRYRRLLAARRLTPLAASPYALALALGLAWDRNPDALSYFRRVTAPDIDRDAASLEWRIRAALWSGRWRLALTSIEALPPRERRASRWRYWTARAAAALGRSARARRIYGSLLDDDDYYSALAAAQLHRTVTPHPEILPVDRTVLERLARLPAMVRARELYRCGLESDARAEWRFAYRTLDAEERMQSILLAARWGWYDQAIETAAAQRIYDDYALLYPRPFRAVVDAAARRTRLAPDLVEGVIRQESLYRADAVSPVGALGLMQLMPQTARRAARHWGMRRPQMSDLFVPSINVALGTAQLRSLLDRFGGHVPLALAGYNAGTAAVVRWLPLEPIAGDVWVENIPYSETREYVERILWHSLLFAWLRDGAPQRSASWLAPVEPLDRFKPLESRSDHIRGGVARLSWRHARPAPIAFR